MALRTVLSLCLGLILAMSAGNAGAAAFGSLTTSVGFLAAMASLFVMKGWPLHLPISSLATLVAAMLVVGGAGLLLWRLRTVGQVATLGNGAGVTEARRASAGSVARVSVAEALLPAGFDRGVLLCELRLHFVRLQHAWDHAEMAAMSALTTPEMLAELCLGLPACVDADGRLQCTEIVTLRAELLGFESLPHVLVASVQFSGLLRESAECGAVPFRELWLLTRSKQATATWRLARHQVLV